MDKCPNCRARLDDAPQCRRCGLELDPLRKVERGFDIVFSSALQCLAEGNAAGAAEHLRQALELRRDPLAKDLLALLQAISLSEHLTDGVDAGIRPSFC